MANFSAFDLSGSIVGLIYNKQRRYKSTTGGLLSILMLFGIAAVTIIYLNEYFKRAKPKMSFEDMKYWNPPLLDISTDFHFSIIMNYKGVDQIRNDIIKIDAVHIAKNGLHSFTTPLSTVPCLLDSEDLINSTYAHQLSNALCFDLSNLTLTGSQLTDVFSFIKIRFTLCVNSDECLPLSQMNQFFEENKPVAVIYFLDTIFQTNDKKKTTNFYNSVDVNVTFGNAKQTNVYFSKNDMLIDESYFFPSAPRNYSHFMVDSFRDLVSVRTENQMEILALNLIASKNKSIIHISYIQISELMANISALANVIMVLFNSIGCLLNHNLFQFDLMQSLFSISSSSNENTTSLSTKGKMKAKANPREKRLYISKPDLCQQSSDSTQNKIITHHQASTNLPFSLFGPGKIRVQGKLMIKEDDKACRKGHIVPTNHLRLTKRDIKRVLTAQFFPFSCCKRVQSTTKSFQNINDFILGYQDQKNVFRKIQEIDLMKYLLFTEEQLTLYQNIPKPEFILSDDYNGKDKESEKEFSAFFCRQSFHYLKTVKEVKSGNDGKALHNLLKNNILKEKIVNNKIKVCLNE